MANNSKAKLKTLYVRRILEEETDAKHGLSLRQIIERLDEYDIPAERKGIYRDIQTLREFGIDIQTFQRNPVEYAIVNKDFSLSELMLLVDTVESCKFLTNRQSRTLITNLKLLASDHERESLNRHIHVPDRVSSKNESVFESIDLIHEAIRLKRQIEFMYYKYGADGERYASNDSKPHIVTPIGITFSEGFYYLSSWNEERGSLNEFRIDRMGKIRITDLKADRNDEITKYTFEGDGHVSFGRFHGDPVTVTLEVDADKIEILMDRFGDAMQIISSDESVARVIVKIHKSEPFFGWITGLGGTVRIDAPPRLKQEYREYLLKLADMYR